MQEVMFISTPVKPVQTDTYFGKWAIFSDIMNDYNELFAQI